MFLTHDHDYLVIDLEATCSRDGSLPRFEMEIIEIGAVIIEGSTLETVSERQTFVKPVLHPELTDFCTELTSITQAQVDTAPGFVEALEGLVAWRDRWSGGALFASWGGFDRAQFERDCVRHRVKYPLGKAHLNVKTRAQDLLGLRKQPGLGKALSMLGMSFAGTHHRGLDDARNVVRIMRRVTTGE